MAMVGADPDRLDSAAAHMRLAADSLDEHSTALGRMLGGLSWLGQVASAFANMWNSHHRPQLGSTAHFIREAADKLTAQAKQQREASSAAGANAALPGAARKAVPVDRPATDAEIRSAVERGLVAAKASRKSLPGGSAKLEAWSKELESGQHSLAEIQAFLKYREMVVLANSLRATVGSAAESGVAAQNAAVEGRVKVALGVGLAVGGGLLGETGVGAKVGGIEASQGGTIANVERVSRLSEEVVRDEAEVAGHAFAEKARLGVETGDPIAIRQAYEIRADAFLMENESKFRASNNVSNTDPAMIRQNAVSEYSGKYEVAVAQGDVAGAFNLGPEWMTASLSAGMNVLVPYSGTATFAVLGTAEAGANAAAAVGYFNVATDASMDQLTRSMTAMRL